MVLLTRLGLRFCRGSGTIYRKRYFDSFWAKNEAKNCKFSRGCGCGYSRWRADHVWRLWRRRFSHNLIQALSKKGVKNITAISNNCGTREGELGVMFKNGQVKHGI